MEGEKEKKEGKKEGLGRGGGVGGAAAQALKRRPTLILVYTCKAVHQELCSRYTLQHLIWCVLLRVCVCTLVCAKERFQAKQ